MKNLAKSKIFINLPKFQNVNTINNIENIKFQIFKTRIAFIKLRQVFIKVLIFWYFNPKYYIQIEINTLSYVINKILS